MEMKACIILFLLICLNFAVNTQRNLPLIMLYDVYTDAADIIGSKAISNSGLSGVEDSNTRLPASQISMQGKQNPAVHGNLLRQIQKILSCVHIVCDG